MNVAASFANVRIGDVICKIEKRDPRTEGSMPFKYVDISSVCNRGFFVSQPKTVAGADAPSRARKVIRTNDVIIATTRPYLKSIARIPGELDNQICSTGFCVLRATDRILPEWLFYWAISDEFMAQLQPRMRGANYPAVTDRDVFQCTIPLPPLAEQRRIVDRIKECMERVEEIERLRLESVESVRDQKCLLRSYTKELYEELSRDHPTQALRESGSVRGGGTPSKKNDSFWMGTIPWITPKDMKRTILADAKLHISQSAIERSAAKLIPVDSVLFVVRGMILAHTFPVAVNRVEASINQDMKAITPTNGLRAEFLATMLRGAEQTLLSLVEVAGHGTRRLQSPRWGSLKIPVPEPSVQQCVIESANRYEAAAEELGAKLGDGDCKELRDAILRRAFSGEL